MVTTEIKADSKTGTQVFISAPDTCRLEKKWREREETLVTENWLFFFSPQLPPIIAYQCSTNPPLGLKITRYSTMRNLSELWERCLLTPTRRQNIRLVQIETNCRRHF